MNLDIKYENAAANYIYTLKADSHRRHIYTRPIRKERKERKGKPEKDMVALGFVPAPR